MLTLFICIPGPAGAKILHAKYSIFEQARFSRHFSGGMWKPVLTLAWSSRDHLGWSLPLFMSSWIDFLGSEEYIYYQLCTRTTYATLLTSKALMSLIRFPAFFILREFCRTSPSNVVAEECSAELLRWHLTVRHFIWAWMTIDPRPRDKCRLTASTTSLVTNSLSSTAIISNFTKAPWSNVSSFNLE